jgi:hypothetical protein
MLCGQTVAVRYTFLLLVAGTDMEPLTATVEQKLIKMLTNNVKKEIAFVM